ncbi:uncharacterized protein LOC143280317 [Babylonia areolata]|uniref:uncharacterized protein LOC143280317 n=1 Tax=Babylonia areolata TaxID=304850 RepID=UPI003FD5A76F
MIPFFIEEGFLAYWHGNPVTPEYIMRAMRYFTDRFQHVHFVVASQDSDWCQKHVSRNRNDVTIMEGNSAAVDMVVLTLTDHMIVSVGTFGWWAGYLNQGIKTYMKDFIGPRSIFSESFDDLNATDYIYPGWATGEIRRRVDGARLSSTARFLAYWHGHNPVTPEYIMRAMRYFTDRFQHVHFVVASQDSDWCRKHVSQNRNDVTIMEGNLAAVDMVVLTLTDHMIVSVGTFGWWAGYLNQGIKTYMKDFIRPRSIFSESFDDLNATDYIYPGWVGLQP